MSPRLAVWMDAFHVLNAGRNYTVASGMAKAVRLPMPLQVSEILTVAEEFGLPRRDFLSIAQILDQTYLAREIAKS